MVHVCCCLRVCVRFISVSASPGLFASSCPWRPPAGTLEAAGVELHKGSVLQRKQWLLSNYNKVCKKRPFVISSCIMLYPFLAWSIMHWTSLNIFNTVSGLHMGFTWSRLQFAGCTMRHYAPLIFRKGTATYLGSSITLRTWDWKQHHKIQSKYRNGWCKFGESLPRKKGSKRKALATRPDMASTRSKPSRYPPWGVICIPLSATIIWWPGSMLSSGRGTKCSLSLLAQEIQQIGTRLGRESQRMQTSKTTQQDATSKKYWCHLMPLFLCQETSPAARSPPSRTRWLPPFLRNGDIEQDFAAAGPDIIRLQSMRKLYQVKCSSMWPLPNPPRRN